MELIEYVLALVIIAFLAFLLDYLSYRSLESYFPWLLIVMTFFVYVGMLELWMLILVIIACVFVVSISLYRNGLGVNA